MRNYIWPLICAAAFISISPVSAEEPRTDARPPHERGFNPDPVFPEESARRTTDRMDSLLNLTKKQYDKLYKLHLKWAREDWKAESGTPGMRRNPQGRPPQGRPERFGHGPRGNRPPRGDMNQRPPRNQTPAVDKDKIEKQRQKREKKLKKILSAEQYLRWEQEMRPPMPERQS